MSFRRAPAVLICAFCLAVHATASFAWTAAGLQVIGADYQLYPTGISADGSTIIGAGLTLPLGSSRVGMTWTAAGGLHHLSDPGAVPYGIPVDVTADGDTILGYNLDSSNVRTDWVWTASLGYQPLPSRPPLAATIAFSDDGKTFIGNLNDGSTYPVCVWTASGSNVTLPGKPDGAVVLSGDGRTAFYGTVNNGMANGAMVWTASDGARAVSVPQNTYNIYPSVSSFGGSRIFGEASDDQGWFAFRYSDGVIASLGAPSLVTSRGSGLAVVGGSDDGSILVGRQFGMDPDTNQFVQEEWVWTPDGGFVSLDALLAAEGFDLGTYAITDISGISPDGRTLFGTGRVDGIQPSTWVAVIPEPSLVAIAPTVACLLGRRACASVRPRG